MCCVWWEYRLQDSHQTAHSLVMTSRSVCCATVADSGSGPSVDIQTTSLSTDGSVWLQDQIVSWRHVWSQDQTVNWRQCLITRFGQNRFFFPAPILFCRLVYSTSWITSLRFLCLTFYHANLAGWLSIDPDIHSLSWFIRVNRKKKKQKKKKRRTLDTFTSP